MRAFTWWLTALGVFAGGVFTFALSHPVIAIGFGVATVVCVIGGLRSVDERVSTLSAPKIRISAEADIRDVPEPSFTFENIGTTAAFDIRTRDVFHKGRTLTFDPITSLRAGEKRDQSFQITERNGDVGLVFGGRFDHFIAGDQEANRATVTRRKKGDYSDLFQPVELTLDVFFWDEDRQRQYKATHNLTYDYAGFRLRVWFVSQTEVRKPWRSRGAR